ncbi:MAG: LuxR C-terminal-related transcriptional regulator [Amaricoccus sp.]
MNILRLICWATAEQDHLLAELSIAEATASATHIAAIMGKINVRNRTQAALLASKARIFAR